MLRQILLGAACACFLLATQSRASTGADSATPKVDIPLDEAGFTAYVRDRILLLHPGTKVSIAEPLVVSIEGGITIGLGRIHDFCSRVPDRCAEELNTFIATMTEAQQEQSYDASLLRAVV